LWALTKAEDYIVLDAIDMNSAYVPKDDCKWEMSEFHYIKGGKMLADSDLITLNNHLKRKAYPPIILVESHSDSHSILSGPEKAQMRTDILEDLRNMTVEQRGMVLEQKRREIALQPGRSSVQDAVKAARVSAGQSPPSKLAQQLSAATASGTLTLPAKTEKPPVLPTPMPSNPQPRPARATAAGPGRTRS
jgi:hypothetical protein